MLVSGIFGVIQLKKINENIKTLYEHPILVRKSVKDIVIETYFEAHNINDVLFAENKKQIDSLTDIIKQNDIKIEQYFKIVKENFLGNKKDVDTAHNKYLLWRPVVAKIIRLKRENKPDSLTIEMNNFNHVYADKIPDYTIAIVTFAENKTDELVNSTYSIGNKTISTSIFVFVFAFMVGICITIIVTTNITRPIDKFVHAARQTFSMQNDFKPIKFKSEKELFNHTLQELKIAYQNIEQQNEEIKMQNEQLVLLNVSLDDRVNKRTIELQTLNDDYIAINEELNASIEEVFILNESLTSKIENLKELNATKDKFFSILTHDLKNPFNTIFGFSKLLLDNIAKYDAEKIVKFVGAIYTSSQKAFKLLENLLEWSRIQTGQLEPNLKKIKPTDLINEIKSECLEMADAKNINLAAENNFDGFILADKEMIKAILRNLLTNAIKFTYSGGKINIKSQKSNENILFVISDTGTGIEPEHIDKLFRIDNKLSRKGTADETGTSLGLLLCKEFIEKHGGKIWAESELGKGSEFKFTIPLHHAPEA